MSDTITQPGSSRVRQMLAATRKAPRRLRIAGLAGLIAAVGTAALIAAPAAANAATIVNPSCPVPSNITFQETSQSTYNLLQGISRSEVLFVTQSNWQATYNGQNYTGTSVITGTDAAAVAAPNTVTAGEDIPNTVLIATCIAG